MQEGFKTISLEELNQAFWNNRHYYNKYPSSSQGQQGSSDMEKILDAHEEVTWNLHLIEYRIILHIYMQYYESNICIIVIVFLLDAAYIESLLQP